MNELQVFSKSEFGSVRTTMIAGDPWFVGKDVAKALGYTDTACAIRDHVDAEDKGVGEIPTPGGTQQLIVINESGLYSLIFSSKLPSAKRFKRWVTNEVLPAIRRTGKYEMPDIPPDTLPDTPRRALTPDDYLRAAHIVAGCRNERMPVVLSLLRGAGIDVKSYVDRENLINLLPERPKYPGRGAGQPHLSRSEQQSIQYLIKTALTRPGVTMTELSRRTGLSRTQIARTRDGNCSLTKNAVLIEDAIRELCPDLFGEDPDGGADPHIAAEAGDGEDPDGGEDDNNYDDYD